MSRRDTGCSVDGCNRLHFGKGYCNTHYYRIRRNGTLELKPKRNVPEVTPRSPSEECGVDGCSRKAARRCGGLRVCGMHGHRYDRHGSFEATRTWSPPNPDKRDCSVEGCGSLEDGRSAYCKLHGTRVRRHGDPMKRIHQRDRRLPRGSAHPKWAGDRPSYDTVHQRLRRERGSARDHTCGCGKPAAQWAYQHGSEMELIGPMENGALAPYSTDFSAYEAMCVSCHKKYDLSRER